jgi:hypothetical protein
MSTSVSHEAIMSCAKQVSYRHGLPHPASTLAPLGEGLLDHNFFRQHLCVLYVSSSSVVVYCGIHLGGCVPAST